MRGTAALLGAMAMATTAAPAHASISPSLTYRSPMGGLTKDDQAGSVGVTVVPDAAPLGAATLILNGVAAGSSGFDCGTPPSCTATIAFDTTRFADGSYNMVVKVRDTAGDEGTATGVIEIWNNRPQNCPRATPTSCSADLSIGSSGGPPEPPPVGSPGGGIQGASETSCKAPRLSMSLVQRPLRISHGVPVLLKNKRYRFTGRLTCLVSGQRKSAGKGTRISVSNLLRGRTYRRAGAKVGNGGKISLRLRYPSSRTIEFRFSNADGTTSKVRIRVLIAKRKG